MRPRLEGQAALAVTFILSAIVAVVMAVGTAHAQSRAYVVNNYSNSVSVLDTSQDAPVVIRTILVGRFPRTAAMAGTTLYVTNAADDTVSMVDTRTLRVVGSLRTGRDPDQIAIKPDDQSLALVTNRGGDSVTFLDLTNDGANITEVPVGTTPIGVTFVSGARAVVANWGSRSLSILDTEQRAVLRTVSMPKRPLHMALYPGGGFLFVVSDEFPDPGGSLFLVDLATDEVFGIDTGRAHVSIVLTSDGTRAFLTQAGLNGVVIVLDLESYQVIRTISTGVSQRPFALALTPDDRLLYVTNASGGTVSVIDTRNLQVVATVEVGDLPWDIVLQYEPTASGAGLEPASPNAPEGGVPRK